MPKVGPEYFAKNPLSFDAGKKIEELRDLAKDIDTTLGAQDACTLLKEIAEEYATVVEMLQARGTKTFWEKSRKLYGSPKDLLIDGKNTIRELGLTLYTILGGLDHHLIGPDYPETIEAEETVKTLNSRFKKYFPDGSVEARLSDGILADAAAGGDVVKIKEGTEVLQP